MNDTDGEVLLACLTAFLTYRDMGGAVSFERWMDLLEMEGRDREYLRAEYQAHAVMPRMARA